MSHAEHGDDEIEEGKDAVQPQETVTTGDKRKYIFSKQDIQGILARR